MCECFGKPTGIEEDEKEKAQAPELTQKTRKVCIQIQQDLGMIYTNLCILETVTLPPRYPCSLQTTVAAALSQWVEHILPTIP